MHLLNYYIILPIYFCHCKDGSKIPLLFIKNKTVEEFPYLSREDIWNIPFIMSPDKSKDTNEYWRDTEIISVVKAHYDDDPCRNNLTTSELVQIPSRRTLRPICRSKDDYQLCPQCPYFSNKTECELFRDSCRERRVHPSEYNTYCNNKYGNWRTMFIPADYSKCQCCDECVHYRELDQSCVHDEYDFNAEEFLPTTTIDFRAGCNPYTGHQEEKLLSLRCDKVLRRCVPNVVPPMPQDIVSPRRNYRYQALRGMRDCPPSCRGFVCPEALVPEHKCSSGAFIPNADYCNCCGRCSAYYQFNEKCAEYTRTQHNVNGSTEIEVEEEFHEPGCDDGLVCRQGRCQDIHTVASSYRRKRSEEEYEEDDEKEIARGFTQGFSAHSRSVNEESYGCEGSKREPCKYELKYFKKKYGEDGHLHYDAPQCTPLWLYAPVQCRRFMCYCALEDGTMIEGIKVPRVEVSNMNCDCAREKCRSNNDLECDGYGNYKNTFFTQQHEELPERSSTVTTISAPPPTHTKLQTPTRVV